MKYKIYTHRSFTKILKENGYRQIRQTGSHTIWEHGIKHNKITVALELNPMIARRLIKENHLVEVK